MTLAASDEILVLPNTKPQDDGIINRSGIFRIVYNISGKIWQPQENKPEESPNYTEQGTG